MAQDSKIEWCHHTANLWWGCIHVHAGCDNCYAEVWAKRYQPTELWGKDSKRMAIKGVWNDLASYQRKAAAAGEIHRVFVGSMMDIFELPQSVIDRNGDPIDSERWEDEHLDMVEIRQKFFLEVVAQSPNLDFLLLTKRPSNINKMIPLEWASAPPANVMFGTSIVDQKSMKTLLPQLKGVAGRRFLSIEPQLEPIPDIDLSGIDWLIQGGESGHGARPFQPEWAHNMVEQCDQQGVPYFFKQTGSWLAKDWGLKSAKGGDLAELPDFMRVRQFPVIPAIAN